MKKVTERKEYLLYIHPSCQLLSKWWKLKFPMRITVIAAKLMQFTKYTMHFMRFSWIIPKMYHIKTFVWKI